MNTTAGAWSLRARLILAHVALTGVLLAAHVTSAQDRGVSPGLPDSREAYEAQRRALTTADVAQRFDAGLALSASEQTFNARLVDLRHALVAEYRSQKRFPPAEPFYAVKEQIAASELFKLLRSMPKGGVLHLHTSSTAPASWIIDRALREPGCCVCWPDDQGDALRGQLGFYAADKLPPGFQPAADVLAADAEFPAKLLDLLTFGTGDARLNNLEIWGKFNAIFQRVGGVMSYQPLYQDYYRAAFQTLLDDNVQYVELRAGFGDLYDLEGNTWGHREQAQLMWQVRNEVREQHPEFDLKLIYSGHRGVSVDQLWPQLEKAVELRTAWAKENFVVGFDIVGEEDAGHTTAFFLPDWIKLKAYLNKRDATLPLYFHDGESDWPSDQNLYDAFLLGSRRIGHGFNLFRFPTLERELKRRGVAVEVCPISNQALRYVDDLRIHPASGYLNRGVPCVLASDDPGIFGNDGLSFDFWQAVVAWRLDLKAIKQLAQNSLTYCAMHDDEKAKALAAWSAAWDRWVAQNVRQ